MKQIKLLVLAFTILLGTTFTSCLDSDNGPMTYYAFATVNNSLGYITLTDDEGLTLIPVNPTDMKYKDGTYPERAYFGYNLAEGQEYQNGVTKYEIKFLGYAAEVATPKYSKEPVDSKTYLGYIIEEGWLWATNNYLTMRVGIQYADGVNTEEDFVLYPDKVEDNILYFRLAHIKEVEKKEGIYELYMSFKLPEKDELKAKFEELEFSGDNGDEVEVVITAEGGKDTILKTKAVKIRIPIKH